MTTPTAEGPVFTLQDTEAHSLSTILSMHYDTDLGILFACSATSPYVTALPIVNNAFKTKFSDPGTGVGAAVNQIAIKKKVGWDNLDT